MDGPPPARRSSFGNLLRRTKSGDLGKSGRRSLAARDAELDRQRQHSVREPPKLPEFANNSEQLSKSFGPDLQPDPSYKAQPTSRSAHGFVDFTGRETGSPFMDRARGGVSVAAPPVPPIPNIPSVSSVGNVSNGAGAFDPYARTESMTHRGRFSYASSAVSSLNSPRRVRRRKDPTAFNILVAGARSSGKTSFLEFLKGALALPPKKRAKRPEDDFQVPTPASGNFIPHYLETEIDGERIGLTIWDSEGLEKNLVDLQLREMSAFLESKFEETFAEEMKVVRSPGVQDTHIHAAFLILDPARLDQNIAAAAKRSQSDRFQNGHRGLPPHTLGGLDDELDLQVMRLLQGKTTVIPVISKADTVTTKHMDALKKTVWNHIKKCNLDPLEALRLDDDASSSSDRIDEESEGEHGSEVAVEESPDTDTPEEKHSSPPTSPGVKRLSSQSLRKHKAQEEGKEEETPFLPLSIISPDLYEPSILGRQFPWGFADPYDSKHCDFQRLKEAVFSEWRAELREASREQWYEGWRTNRLKQRSIPYHRR